MKSLLVYIGSIVVLGVCFATEHYIIGAFFSLLFLALIATVLFFGPGAQEFKKLINNLFRS